MKHRKLVFMALCSVWLSSCTPTEEKSESTSFEVPVDYYKLDNGLKVILSQDRTYPAVVIAAHYR